MANTYLTIDMITNEAVMLFLNSNLFIMNMDRQYDDQFAVDGAKIGDTLRIRLPSDFTVNDGPAMQLQDNTQQYTTLTVSSQKNVATPYTTAERTMSIDRFSELIMAPMVNNLCAKVASTIMLGSEGGVCNLVSNTDGAGNIISPTADQFLQGNAVLDDNGAVMDDRRIVNSPTTDARTTTALQGLLNPTPEISQQYRSGKMKSGLGYERWFRDQTVINHTTGSFDGTATVSGGNQTTGTGGGSIVTTATVGTLKKGDIITFGGVNAVNRLTKSSLATLRQFVVTADVAAGSTSIPVYPGLIPPSTFVAGGPDVQYQTVDSSPINGAAITLATPASSVYRKSLAYTQKAVTMATADLVMPRKAVEEAARTNYDGVAMRILTDYLPLTDQLATRVDVLFGYKYIRPEWLCVVADKI
jgi:P22 coat protein - gene protein 5